MTASPSADPAGGSRAWSAGVLLLVVCDARVRTPGSRRRPSRMADRHGRAVLVHRSAPGDDGRAGPRGSRERPVLGKVGLPSGRLRGRARAVGLGAGTDRSRSGGVAAAPGSLSGVRADAGAAAAERVMRRADAVAMIGTALLAKASGAGHSPDRGGAQRAVLDGAGLAAPLSQAAGESPLSDTPNRLLRRQVRLSQTRLCQEFWGRAGDLSRARSWRAAGQTDAAIGDRLGVHATTVARALVGEHRLSNGLVESTNTKVGLLTRMAFGFKSPEAMIALAMLNLGGYCPPATRPPRRSVSTHGTSRGARFTGESCDGRGVDTVSKPCDGAPEPLIELNRGFPAQVFAGQRDVGLPDAGIVHGSVDEADQAAAAGELADAFGQGEDTQLLRVAQVDRAGQVGVQQRQDASDQVVDVTDGAGLGTVTGDGQWLFGQCLADEGRDRATVVRSHPRAVGVEDAGDTGVHAMGTPVGHGRGLGEPLRLVVHPPRAHRVHMPPVGLRLRMHLRIAVALGGGGEQETSALVLSQTQGVQRAERTDLQRLDRQLQVIDWGGGGGEVQHGVHGPRHVQIVRDVAAKQPEPLVAEQVLDIVWTAGAEVVQTQHAVTGAQ